MFHRNFFYLLYSTDPSITFATINAHIFFWIKYHVSENSSASSMKIDITQTSVKSANHVFFLLWKSAFYTFGLKQHRSIFYAVEKKCMRSIIRYSLCLSQDIHARIAPHACARTRTTRSVISLFYCVIIDATTERGFSSQRGKVFLSSIPLHNCVKLAFSRLGAIW